MKSYYQPAHNTKIIKYILTPQYKLYEDPGLWPVLWPEIYIVIMMFLLFWWRPCNFGCNIQDITLDSIFNHIWNKTNNWEGREKGASAFFPVEWGFPVSNLNRYYRFLIQTWLAWLCDWEFPMPGTPFLPVFCLLLPLHPRPGFWLFPREKK